MEDPNEPTSQVDRGILAFLQTITIWGLALFIVLAIGGSLN